MVVMRRIISSPHPALLSFVLVLWLSYSLCTDATSASTASRTTDGGGGFPPGTLPGTAILPEDANKVRLRIQVCRPTSAGTIDDSECTDTGAGAADGRVEGVEGVGDAFSLLVSVPLPLEEEEEEEGPPGRERGSQLIEQTPSKEWLFQIERAVLDRVKQTQNSRFPHVSAGDITISAGSGTGTGSGSGSGGVDREGAGNGITSVADPGRIAIAPPPPSRAGWQRRLEEGEGEGRASDPSTLWFNGSMAFVCVLVAALAAGLTMGMVSIDPLHLLIKMRCGTPTECAQAESIYPLIKQHHRLLVTLLLLNSIANEALPLFLDRLVPSYAAVIISVTLVLIFGEIIPSAVFTGPNQIPMASFMSPAVKVAMILLCPLAWPLAKALDLILGHGDEEELSNMYDRGELSALVRIMYEQERAKKRSIQQKLVAVASGLSEHRVPDDDGEDIGPIKNVRQSSIHFDEVNMVEGALMMRSKFASDIFIPLKKVFAVEYNTVLDEDSLTMIYSSGYSRIPVYIRRKPKKQTQPPEAKGKGKEVVDISGICGVLLTRQLIVVDSDDMRPVSSMPLLQATCVEPEIELVDLLNIFQEGGATSARGGHLAIVCERPDIANEALAERKPIPQNACVLGIVTLEDVIEQLLQENIVDESDKLEIKAMRRARLAVRKWRSFVVKKRANRDLAEETINDGQHRGTNLEGGTLTDESPLLPKKVHYEPGTFSA